MRQGKKTGELRISHSEFTESLSVGERETGVHLSHSSVSSPSLCFPINAKLGPVAAGKPGLLDLPTWQRSEFVVIILFLQLRKMGLRGVPNWPRVTQLA